MMRLHRPVAPILLSLFLVGACSSAEQTAFQTAQSSDTIEAYESFLTEHPENSYQNVVSQRLEALYYKEASTGGEPEYQRKYLEKFPDGKYVLEIQGAYEKARYKEVSRLDNAAKYKAFLDDFPNGTYAFKVKKLYASASYRSKVALEDVGIKSSRGKWIVSAQIANQGDKAVDKLKLNLKTSDGLNTNVSLSTEGELEPGSTLKFEHTLESVPEGFAGQELKVAVDTLLLKT